MRTRKTILVINGSASEGSSNQRLIDKFSALAEQHCNISLFRPLRTLPHFDPGLAVQGTPAEVISLRNAVASADAIVFFTPEYIFSIPSGLKNALEWCVATTVFSGKPAGIVTASAHGQKGHEELQLILKTVGALLNEETCLLIQGVKGKVDQQGNIIEPSTYERFQDFVKSCLLMIEINS